MSSSFFILRWLHHVFSFQNSVAFSVVGAWLCKWRLSMAIKFKCHQQSFFKYNPSVSNCYLYNCACTHSVFKYLYMECLFKPNKLDKQIDAL